MWKQSCGISMATLQQAKQKMKKQKRGGACLMAALRGMAGLNFWQAMVPQRQFCGISIAVQGSGRLAGGR